MEKQLAVIEGVGFGNRDVGRPVLFFSTMISEGTGALQVMEGKEAMDLIKAYDCWDIKGMEGKPIWVNIDSGIMKVAGAWKP